MTSAATLPFSVSDALPLLQSPDFEALFPDFVLSAEDGRLNLVNGGAARAASEASESEPCVRFTFRGADGDELLCRDLLQLQATVDGGSVLSWTRSAAAPGAPEFCAVETVPSLLRSVSAALRGLPRAPFAAAAEPEPAEWALYFGTFEVRMDNVPGRSFAHEEATLAVVNSRARRAAARRRLRDQSELGAQYAGLYVPSIPAADLVADYPLGAAAMPAELARPLLKTEAGAVGAVRSGCRSAVLYPGHRLKGCNTYVDGTYGDLDLRVPFPGFPRVPFPEHDPKIDLATFEPTDGATEIRGCTFEHMVHREQHISARVDALLRPLNLACGNAPEGYWTYDVPEDDTPAVPKCCGLFRTLGERRLASHLLAGLDALLPALAPAVALDDVLAGFAADRERDWETVTTDPVTLERATARHPVRPTWSACCSGVGAEPSDFCGLWLEESVPGAVESASGVLSDVWTRAAAALRAAVPVSQDAGGASRPRSVLAYLHWRLGREAGECKRALADAGISWGYFQDHGVEPHNNSHPNNFVVVPPSDSGLLIAPVDFDMAYGRDEFFSQITGELCPEDFDDNLRSELSEMERALAGEAASTGLVGVGAAGDGLSDAHAALRWAMRDTLLAGFRSAVRGRADAHPRVPALDAAARALVELALVGASDRVS